MEVIIKQTKSHKGTMYEMCMSYCMRCTCWTAPHVHLVLYEMCMSCSTPHWWKKDILKRKTDIVYEEGVSKVW